MKFAILIFTALVTATANAAITVYHDRPEDKMQPIVQAFTQKTGIAVTLAPQKKAKDLKNQLVSEGSSSAADVAIVKDLVYLNDLTQANVLQPLNSDVAKSVVLPAMQSDLWTAITYRARTLVYDTAFDVSGINTYKDLADPKYKGQLCLRTSKSSYNQALGASLVASYGNDEAYDILEAWLKNLTDSTGLFDSDSKMIKSIAGIEGFSKDCNLAMVNTYYLGKLLQTYPDLPVAAKFLTLEDGGVSTNGIGAGITKSSDSVAEARQFIEFMLSEEMQKYFSGLNQDFPANKNVGFDSNIKNWEGSFNPSPLNWSDLGGLLPETDELFFDLGYL